MDYWIHIITYYGSHINDVYTVYSVCQSYNIDGALG